MATRKTDTGGPSATASTPSPSARPTTSQRHAAKPSPGLSDVEATREESRRAMRRAKELGDQRRASKAGLSKADALREEIAGSVENMRRIRAERRKAKTPD